MCGRVDGIPPERLQKFAFCTHWLFIFNSETSQHQVGQVNRNRIPYHHFIPLWHRKATLFEKVNNIKESFGLREGEPPFVRSKLHAVLILQDLFGNQASLCRSLFFQELEGVSDLLMKLSLKIFHI